MCIRDRGGGVKGGAISYGAVSVAIESVVVGGGGVRVWLLRGIPRGMVCHPFVLCGQNL